MLPRTGFKTALAAETVSFWICINVALLDFFSPNVVFVEIPPPPLDTDVGAAADGAVDPDDAVVIVEAVDGSAVIRSIKVVPEESCK